jgi:hypothetical protein|tara:strand:+ start:72 stop:488 length:417 start_codon:yes stop_codon:yes gene_type:complete
MKRTIKNPYWGNDEKTQVMCEFHFENGPTQVAAVTQTKEGNPDWEEIFQNFTIEQIDDLTKTALAEAREEHEKRKQQEKDDIERMKVDALFQAKLDAFDIDIIKNSKNRQLKSRIRKAKTLLEVTAFASALITLEHEK